MFKWSTQRYRRDILKRNAEVVSSEDDHGGSMDDDLDWIAIEPMDTIDSSVQCSSQWTACPVRFPGRGLSNGEV
jgi:hypothetical protein